jgi:hypothetical protein
MAVIHNCPIKATCTIYITRSQNLNFERKKNNVIHLSEWILFKVSAQSNIHSLYQKSPGFEPQLVKCYFSIATYYYRYFSDLIKSVARMSRRGVWQLNKLVFNYCDHSGSSRGARCDPSSPSA